MLRELTAEGFINSDRGKGGGEGGIRTHGTSIPKTTAMYLIVLSVFQGVVLGIVLVTI